MTVLKGMLVRKWVETVDRLCDDNPAYALAGACRDIAHRLDGQKKITAAKIEKAAEEYWGTDKSPECKASVDELKKVKALVTDPRENRRGPIVVLRPLKLKTL